MPRAIRKILALLLLAALPACRDKEGESADDPVNATIDFPLPGPERARAAADRVRPGLTRDLEAQGLQFRDPVFIRAFKEERELELWVRDRESQKFVLFRTYPIAAASGKPGPKLAEGDRQVPEGFYFVSTSRLNPASKYHLAFNLGFPNEYDRMNGRTGSSIMIHGDQVSIGCLAMTDEKIEEIYTLVAAALERGQPFVRVHLFPFRMTDERMETENASEWAGFWRNLKQGYDLFEQTRVPPQVHVVNGRYTFE
ncbi:murein L,D-transpeptidase family protein [Haloferula sargassicola]|uniref:L,D-TPase catalytic domain-containing protein n=1 Tax=Haloferula sargassicola TaxID=490096 RepID=A0ABP9UTF0_9BACT